MASIRLFIADADPVHVRRVEECVQRQKDMEIAGVCANGCEALKALARTRVDLLLTDVQLPGLSGILLLKDLTAMNLCPPAIICTRFYSDLCVDFACQLGASFVAYKPLDYSRLPALIHACLDARRHSPAAPADAEGLPDARRAAIVREKLTELGIPLLLSGALCLTEAIALLTPANDRLLMRNLSKGLYVQVAGRVRSTPARVERAVRTAISVGFDRGALGRSFDHRPSNREFIQYLYDAVKGAE